MIGFLRGQSRVAALVGLMISLSFVLVLFGLSSGLLCR
jgi:hypothetical protein